LGLRIDRQITIDFWLHRLLFERKIQKLFVKYMGKQTQDRSELLIKLNSQLAYRALSELCAVFSQPHLFAGGDRWGYCFIAARKL